MTPNAPAPITDPMLAALLLYLIQAADPDEHITPLAAIVAPARRIVTAGDATAIANDLPLGTVTIHDCIREILTDWPLTADDGERAIIAAIYGDEPGTIVAHAEYVSAVVAAGVSDAFAIGAATMYLILRGGAR